MFYMVCPYCFKTLRWNDLKRICPVCNKEVFPSAADVLLKRSPMCRRQGCRNVANKQACRYCNNELPPNIMDFEKDIRFSLLGTTGSGKSTFLTTMLHELRNLPDSQLSISPMNDLTNKIFRENDRILYEMKKPIDCTLSGVSPPPLLWKIKKMKGRKISSRPMTIFDISGCDCEHIDHIISRHIVNSKFLVIVIDPLSLPGVAENISLDILRMSLYSNNVADYMVDNIIHYIRECFCISPGKLINQDIAVVLTKIDVVKDSFGTATVMQPSPHLVKKGFVTDDADAVDAEVRNWLAVNGGATVLNAIETNFLKKCVRFFGVSSFGQPPIGDGILGQIMPHRVLDPLMWMLSKEKIVPVI